MTLSPRPRPKIIIVGAGIAGLMMGILLDKMDIPYQILERAPKVKPLGEYPSSLLSCLVLSCLFCFCSNRIIYCSPLTIEARFKRSYAIIY